MTFTIPKAQQYTARQDFLPFSPPDVGPEEIQAVVEALQSGWITTGPQTKRFEQEFAAYIGVSSAVALNSCTGALHVALAAMEIGPGDEVITTPMTFCATANVIEHVGATTVLADITPDTLNLDPARVEAAITPRTKAILPVHFAGHPVDMQPIMELAARHGLYVIEDAAHSLPATYRGQRIGTIGHLTAFSFYATKNLTTAEGGMLTGDPALLDKARVWGLHGMNRDAWKRYTAAGSWYYEVTVPGFKYNMTDMQAAIGLVQLGRLEQMQARRRAIVAQYDAAFANLDTLEAPTTRPDVEHAHHLYVVRLNLDKLRIDRAQFIEELKARNIGSSVHFIPLHLHPYYREQYGWQPDAFPVALREYQRTVSLPLHPRLSDQDVSDVIGAVQNILDTHRAD